MVMCTKPFVLVVSLIAVTYAQQGATCDVEAALVLNPANLQSSSKATGQGATPNANQKPSKTDNGNFINFCNGKITTNGRQNKAGSCNGIVMGDLPAQTKMISSVIVSPEPGQDLPPNKAITIQVQVANLDAGQFVNPQVSYFTAPQQLNKEGFVMGHTHVTVQNMGGTMTPTQPLDASNFVFFKGINDAGNGKGLLSTTIPDGLPAGYYRVCTMNSAENHQPVLMPVAQRGSQDDCTKFSVGINPASQAARKPELHAVHTQTGTDRGEKLIHRRQRSDQTLQQQQQKQAAKQQELQARKAQDETLKQQDLQKQQVEAQIASAKPQKKAQEGRTEKKGKEKISQSLLRRKANRRNKGRAVPPITGLRRLRFGLHGL